MTREECIALLDRYANYNGMGIPNLAGCKEAMRKAVELLSAKPSEDLTTEVKKYFQGLWPGMETAEQCNTNMHFTPPAIMRLARHFYELGKQSKEPVSEDLEEEIEKYYTAHFDYITSDHPTLYILANIACHFAEWQKEQMLKDAVEGFVGVHLHDKRADVTVNTAYLPKEMGIRWDSKVKVIIVKEEEK